MVERIDNLIQFAVTLVGCALSCMLYLKERRQAYFTLTCFYGCFTLGSLYWTLYLFLFDQTPLIFLVPEIAWISGCIFLYLLQYTLSTAEERMVRHPAAWLTVLAGALMLGLYICAHSAGVGLVRCGVMTVLAWHAVRGLCGLRGKGEHPRRRFYGLVVCFVAAEYCLWTASFFWVSDTLTNPYFWFDFLLTGTLFALLPAVRKAVGG